MIANLTRIGLRQGFGRQVGLRSALMDNHAFRWIAKNRPAGRSFGRQVGRIALAIALLVVPGATQALTSASYILYDEVPNYGERVNAASTSYRLNEAGITWFQVPLASASYAIVAAPPQASSSSSSSTASSGGGAFDHGGRRGAGVSFGPGIGPRGISGPSPLGRPAAPVKFHFAPATRSGMPDASPQRHMHYRQRAPSESERSKRAAPQTSRSPESQRGNAPAAAKQQRGADHSGVQRKRGARRVGLRASLLDARAAFSAPDGRDIVAIVASLAILGWVVLRFFRALEHVIARFSPLNLTPRPTPVPRKRAPKTRSPFVIRPV